MTPDEIIAGYNSLTDAVKQSLDWEFVKRNKSWLSEREAVKSHLTTNGSLSLKAARDLHLVPNDMTSSTFVKCIIDPLKKAGFVIKKQSGALPRNATLYHTHGNAAIVPTTKQIFTEPSVEAALFVVHNLINGQTGSINVRPLLSKKQFPFIANVTSSKEFDVLLTNEAEKFGCRSTSKPYKFIREELT